MIAKFAFREQARTTPRIDRPEGASEEPIWNHDEVIRNNLRVPPDSPAPALGAYPRGEGPGVRMGVLGPGSALREDD